MAKGRVCLACPDKPTIKGKSWSSHKKNKHNKTSILFEYDSNEVTFQSKKTVHDDQKKPYDLLQRLCSKDASKLEMEIEQLKTQNQTLQDRMNEFESQSTQPRSTNESEVHRLPSFNSKDTSMSPPPSRPISPEVRSKRTESSLLEAMSSGEFNANVRVKKKELELQIELLRTQHDEAKEAKRKCKEKLRTKKEKYKIKLEELKRENKELQRKNDEWCALARRVMQYKAEGKDFEKAFDDISDKLSEGKKETPEQSQSSNQDFEQQYSDINEETLMMSCDEDKQCTTINSHQVQGVANLGATCWFNCIVPLFNAVRKHLALPAVKIPILRDQLKEFFLCLFPTVSIDDQQDVLLALEKGLEEFIPTKQQRLLENVLSQETTCTQCNNLFIKDTRCSYISLECAPSLKGSFNKLTLKVTLEDDNTYECGMCNKKTIATQLVLPRLAEVSFIHLKRYYQTPCIARKINDSIHLPLAFNDEGQYYVLKGFVVHFSSKQSINLIDDSVNKGHYVAYVQEQKQWFEVDDHIVKEINKENIREISQQAYIALYIRATEADLKQLFERNYSQCKFCDFKAKNYQNLYEHYQSCKDLKQVNERLTLAAKEWQEHLSQAHTNTTQTKLSDFANLAGTVERVLALSEWHEQNAHLLEQYTFKESISGNSNFTHSKRIRKELQKVQVLKQEFKAISNEIRGSRSYRIQNDESEQQLNQDPLSALHTIVADRQGNVTYVPKYPISVIYGPYLDLKISDSESSSSDSFSSCSGTDRGRKRNQKASMKREAQKDAEKRIKKLNREAERQMNIKLIEGLLPAVQDKLTRVESIMAPLQKKHAKKAFKPVGKLFCDGFSVTDPLVKISQLEKFFWKKGGIRLRSKNHSWTTKETLSTKPKKFFLRINDYDCDINDAFLDKLANIMGGFREKLLRKLTKQYQVKHKCEDVPTDVLEELKVKVARVYICKFDDTQDMAGAFIAKDKDDALKKIAELFGYLPATNNRYKSTQSCLQFVATKLKGKRVVRDYDMRHKFYWKDTHLHQVESLNKKVSIGMKPLFNGSKKFIKKFAKTVDDCLSRSERSTTINSVEEEQAFLRKAGQSEAMKQFHQESIELLNCDEEILEEISCDVNRNEFWQLVENGPSCTVIIYTPTQACILKAYCEGTSKFVGLFEPVTEHTLPIDLVKMYALPHKPCYLYEVYSNEYRIVQYIKDSEEVLAWVSPINSNNAQVDGILKKIGVSMQSPRIVGCLKSKDAKIRLVRVIEDFISEEKTQQLRTAQIEVIERRYSNYKGIKKQLVDILFDTRIHLISFAAGKLFLYDKNVHIKYILHPFKSSAHEQLKVLLQKKQHALINGKLVFLEGLTSIELNQLLVLVQVSGDAAAKKELKRKTREELTRKEKEQQRQATKRQKRQEINTEKWKVYQSETSSQTTQLDSKNEVERQITQKLASYEVTLLISKHRGKSSRWLQLKDVKHITCQFSSLNKAGTSYQCHHCKTIITRRGSAYFVTQ